MTESKVEAKGPRRSHRRVAFAGTAAVALTVAVSGLAMAAMHSTPAAKKPAASAVTVSTAVDSFFGTYLVSGNTLYTLKPTTTACAAACVKIWPQLLLPVGVTKATAGSGVDPLKLGKVKLKSGRYQVTYRGHALFKYSKDTSAGQVGGILKNKWGTWNIVVTVKPGTTTTTSGGGIGF